MKHYVKHNQIAWDEAYQHAPEDYKDIVSKLKTNPKTYLNPLLLNHLDPEDVKDKDIAQFACNNGRELLSIGLSFHAASMVGFDLSPTMVRDANASAHALQAPALFVMMDLNDYAYEKTFDTLFISIGVLCWFETLDTLMEACAKALKPGGKLYLVDGHPFTNVYAFEGEQGFDPAHPYLPIHPYFGSKAFVEHSSMGYMSDHVPSQPFTSYTHTLEHLLNTLLIRFQLELFKESNENLLGLFPDLHQKSLPLSYLIKANRT